MAETDTLATRGAQFRTSRYPGFNTPGGNFATGGADPNIGNTSAQAAGSGGGQIDIPEAPGVGDLGNAALGGAAQYGATKIGEGAGAALAGGATAGEATRAGFSHLGESVSGLFDFGGGAAGSTLSSGGGGAAAQGLGSFGGDVMGSAAQEAAGAIGSQAAGSASGTSLAASSFGDRLASGANIGGAMGAGLGTFAVGLLTGQKPIQAAKSGALSALGFAIGSATPLGPVGGFIGSTLMSFFCLGAGTPVLLADGSNTKLVDELRLGDELWLGGRVLGRGEVLVGQVYLYKNTVVGEGHAVYEPARGWLRVEDSEFAVQIDMMGAAGLVYPVLCENHLVCTPWFISADIDEVEATEDLTEAERLARLNADERIGALHAQWLRHAAVVAANAE